MHAFPIHTDADHARALALVDSLWGAAPGSADALLLEVMAQLIDAYEATSLHPVLPPAQPRVVIEAKRAELGLSQRKLGQLLGWKSTGRVSEVLSGKRPLTLDMVRDFERVLGIPPGLLVADRSSSPEGDAWVQLPTTLVTAAQRIGYGGCDGLEAFVRQAVSRALGGAPLTQACAAPVLASDPDPQVVGRTRASFHPLATTQIAA